MGFVNSLLHSNEAIGKVLKDTSKWKTGIEKIRTGGYTQKDLANDRYMRRAKITKDKDGNFINGNGEKINVDENGNISNLSLGNRFRMAHLNADGSLDKSKIATHIAGVGFGEYAGIDIASRGIMGDGLFYQDKNKEFDIAGIPFI